MKNPFLSAFASIVLATSALSAGTPVQFQVDDPMGRNSVQFKTSAPLEDIVGTTNNIKGFVAVDPKSLKASGLAAQFEVNLASLRTGIGLRDTHMREQYLQTGEHPTATFELKEIRKSSDSELVPNKSVKIVAKGVFELHGVKREIEVPVDVVYLPASQQTMGKLPGNLLRVTSNFDVKLADYSIERPSMVLLKVGEVAHVAIDGFATDANPEQMNMWMEQMKKMMASN